MKHRYLLLSIILLSTAASVLAQNISGYVRCKGIGVEGVVVSDGDSVTVTNESGYYALQSQKRNGYVFYSLPRGYEPTLTDGFQPQFWQKLLYANVKSNETHNFTLNKADNDNYTLILGADSHLANRTRDLKQFKEGYIECLKAEKQQAGKGKIYSMILGDLTWDNYWYSRNYNLNAFMNTCKEYGYPMTLWPVIGNHDNDGATPAGDDCDFLSSAPWRNIVCPNYYSFNLGRVHYVVLDDVYYLNEDTGGDYAKGIVGSRNYSARFTPEQLDWLRRDLALVEDKEAPLIVALHVPVWKLGTASPFTATANLADDNSKTLCDMLKEFSNVHIVSGHTHYNYHAHPTGYKNIMEHNIAAICASWWWTGYCTNRHVCRDGSPGGYSLWNVEGDRLQWKYKSIEQNGDLQMRIYDMNTVKDYFETNDSVKKMLEVYPSRTVYRDFAKNTVLINVFAYDTDWRIFVYEGSKRRTVTRIYGEDPYHTICYDVPRVFQNGSYTSTFTSCKVSHLFKVQANTADNPITVRLTDSFGNQYVQSIRRPHPFSLDMEQQQTSDDLSGIRSVANRQQPQAAVAYDLQGRPAGHHSRGIVIQKGKKIHQH